MYKIYPVTKTENVCEDYEVYVNGERVDLNVARVSAYPFNRRWPGHQRQIDQTELINFLSMETDEEVELMRKNGVFVAHCPASNMNLTSGIAPIRRYLDLGLDIGLGSDIAGGHSLSIFRAITDAIQVSKMYFRMVDEGCKPLVFSEAFYLATKGGGAFFGKVGSFEEGYEFDAVVMDDSVLAHPQTLNLAERMERAVYLGLDEKNITAKYVTGRKVL